MNVLQAGIAFARVMRLNAIANLAYDKVKRNEKVSFNKYFHVTSPNPATSGEIEFNWILRFVNQPFTFFVKGLQHDCSDTADKRGAYLEVSCVLEAMLHAWHGVAWACVF